MSLTFDLLRTCGQARLGLLRTPHGEISTPNFMPVATLGAVKGITAQELEAAGAQVMLANLYHLTLRPGIEVISDLGGIHRFTGWQRPILTDSGGFQVFSLAPLRQIDADGVTFKSHLDGSLVRFSPASVVTAQHRLGVDLAMVLDECPPWPIDEAAASASLARTQHWARAAREVWAAIPAGTAPGGLLGIVQGSAYRNLRERAVAELVALDFDGYAIGGVSVGESDALRRGVVSWTAPLLPVHKPRYLMGLGTPLDILHGVLQGVDLFDCVLPARNARHGALYTRQGLLRIKNAVFRTDERPLDPECGCPLCQRQSRAFLHHLMRSRELAGPVLATLHNLRFYLDFMADLRQGIQLGTLADLAATLADRYSEGGDHLLPAAEQALPCPANPTIHAELEGI